MATQVMQAASIEGGAARILFTYDDVTMLCTRVQWFNDLNKEVLVWATAQDGTPIITEARMPPNTSGSRNLSGANRFNIETNYPNINLAA